MKFATILSAALSAATFTALAQNTAIISANATLKDGSTFKGEFSTKSITGSTIFMEKLELDPALVKTVAFANTNGESKIELNNGDKFAMRVSNDNFAIKSLLGELNIPRTNFRSITLSSRRISAGGCDDGLIFYCTFDDEASLATPAVGPAVKLELGQIKTDIGKNGGSLFVKPGIAGAEIVFPAGTFGEEGCIEFWANMASGKTEFSTGGDPRFFVISNQNGAEKSHFEFASNDGCGNSGLSGHFFGMRTQTNAGCTYLMPYSDVFKGEDYNGWHHYALVWAPTNLSIYIDGRKVCGADGKINTEELAKSELIMDIPLNRITGKSFNNKSAFYMDELKIWNRAKTEFDISK